MFSLLYSFLLFLLLHEINWSSFQSCLARSILSSRKFVDKNLNFHFRRMSSDKGIWRSSSTNSLCILQKPDSLAKLYEMDDSIERRTWLDKLVTFMEEKRSPITSCPTISKNPLDLFRLYLYVKERGGFMEVCKVQCSSI